MKNILVIGSGGREHAFVWKLSKDKNINKIFCIPGNGGTSKIAVNHDINIKDFNKIYEYVKSQNIDMILVGPEAPLNDGIVDFFKKKNIRIFGPDKFASQLECSKLFARKFMLKNNIPQPNYFECDSVKEAYEIKKKIDLPLVLKADGLAAGKGVIICRNESEYEDGIKIMLKDKKFGSACDKISIEECLVGEELSVFAICDGKNYKIIGNAQDHKRIFDGDKGPNTGGMGAYSPTLICNENILNKVENKIIKPTLEGMSKIGHSFTGFLYVGLMIVDDRPYVIEFNVRMGDPEAQVVIPRIKTSMYEIFNSCLNQELENINIDFDNNSYCTIVLVSDGYPEKYSKGQEIKGIDDCKDALLFHAGTTKHNNKYFVSGGRVLNVVGSGGNLNNAINKTYKSIENIQFKGMYYRKDIGHKGLIKEKS